MNILRSKYEFIRTFILGTLRQADEMSYEALNDLAVETLSDSFDGKVNGYIVPVKLALEARGEIERIPRTSPHKLRLSGGT